MTWLGALLSGAASLSCAAQPVTQPVAQSSNRCSYAEADVFVSVTKSGEQLMLEARTCDGKPHQVFGFSVARVDSAGVTGVCELFKAAMDTPLSSWAYGTQIEGFDPVKCEPLSPNQLYRASALGIMTKTWLRFSLDEAGNVQIHGSRCDPAER